MPTLLELRTAVRRKLDRVNAATPSDAELTEWVNESAAELWDLLVTRYEDQLTAYGTTDSAQSSVFSVLNLATLFGVVGPTRLFKLRSLQYSIDGEWREIPTIPMQEWWKYETARGTASPVGYTLVGNSVHVLPSSTASQRYRLFFVPCYEDMDDDSDELFAISVNYTFEVPNNWHEYVVVDSVIKARGKFQQDASLEMARKAELRQRIISAATNRTPGMAKKVVERATHRGRN